VSAVGRWPTGSRERLQNAALHLFVERGYEATSVADIAAAAGVTERTFYRQFGDKREVLFDSGHTLEHAIVDDLNRQPPGRPPLESVAATLHRAAGTFFADRMQFARTRQRVIDANPELREREALKMTSLVDAVATSLENRDVDATTARLSAEMGIAAFKVAFAEWVAADNVETLDALLHTAVARLRSLATD
jgi:AcrR family transcriptional regulator